MNKKVGSGLTISNFNFGDSCKNAANRYQVGKDQNKDGTIVYIYEGLLSVLGFYSGAIDGDFGDGMKAASIEYQRNYSLGIDGVIGGNTAYSMFNNPKFVNYH